VGEKEGFLTPRRSAAVLRSGKGGVDGEVRGEVELVGLREEEEVDGGDVSEQLRLRRGYREDEDGGAHPFPGLAWRDGVLWRRPVQVFRLAAMVSVRGRSREGERRTAATERD
jgi:hypothetical protein